MGRKLLIGLGVVLVAVVAAAVVLWRMFTGPMYRPGDVRASAESLEPLSRASVGRWAVAPGIELHHFEEGQGRAALVIHGGPGVAPLRPWLAGRLLADRYRLVYYHQRGCGLSSRPIAALHGKNMYESMKTLERALGLRAQIADIERIRRILGEERLTLIGHSFGATIASLYAAEFPERVRALVFIAPADLTVMPAPEGNLFEMVRRRLPPPMGQEYERYLSEYFDFRRALSISERESSAFYARFGKYYAAAYGGPMPDNGSSMEAGFVPAAVYLSMGKRHDYSDAVGRVTAPALVIHGANDLQPEAVSRQFAARLPHSRFVSVAGAGHFVLDEQPERSAAAIREFLDSVGR